MSISTIFSNLTLNIHVSPKKFKNKKIVLTVLCASSVTSGSELTKIRMQHPYEILHKSTVSLKL